ncbi:hypothetical protein BSKO_13653 [Bryopsis sp. KO-2023]|nr:hypothetical protein BSKO_13653 [Bryopsis sp. KO-2023]
MEGLYLEDGDLSFRTDLPKPIPAEHEVLIRVTLAGICATDLEIQKGYIPGFKGIPGHEFVGVVEEAKDSAWIGKRVCSSINMVDPSQAHACCGLEHNPGRVVLGIINKDGIFAQYVVVPVENLVEVPDSVTDRQAVFTEPLAAALRIREQVIVAPTARIGVVGPGRLGMLIGKILSLNGSDVTMLGRSPESLKLPSTWGLDVGFSTEAQSDSFDFVVEASGNIHGFENALRIVKPMGTIILKSTFAGSPPIDLTKVVVGEVKVVGSRCGPFKPSMRLLKNSSVPVDDLIDSEYPMSKGLEAFEHAARAGARKILLTP